MVSHIRHDWRYHDKKNQGMAFKSFRSRWESLTYKTQTLENPKYYEDQIIKYGQKATNNTAPSHKSVFELLSCKWTLSNDQLYSNQKSNNKYIGSLFFWRLGCIS